jgi:hypothetical protein
MLSENGETVAFAANTIGCDDAIDLPVYTNEFMNLFSPRAE